MTNSPASIAAAQGQGASATPTGLSQAEPVPVSSVPASIPSAAEDREFLQQAFIRVCRDSGFRLDLHPACELAAKVVGRSPLEIWMAMGGLDVMFKIAAGTHPVVAHPRTAQGIEAGTGEPASGLDPNARLIAAAPELLAALEPFAAGDPHALTEDHLIAAERAYRKATRP